MKLKELIDGLNCTFIGDADTEVVGLAIDDKNVKEGYAYFCLVGAKSDGHDFAKSAICHGASVIITEKRLNICKNEIIVPNSRIALSLMSARFYGDAHKRLELIAVTGTNGKTTTTYILKNIFESSGERTAIVGTNGVIINDKVYESGMTTPDPIFLHEMFCKMVDQGVQVCVMEASAHALDLYKLFGLKFAVSIFTNLTQDHLDYFGSMEKYSKAKQKLFEDNMSQMAVLNADTEFGQAVRRIRKGISFMYSVGQGGDAYCVKKWYVNGEMCLNVCVLGQTIQIKTTLIGDYNAKNILASVLAAKLLGISDESICQGLRDVHVPGRFNAYALPNGALSIVDYAHTPDAVQNVLSECRHLTRGRLVVVFGCGGDRDRSKRKIMGQMASTLADKVYVTSDNPRFENPLDIINDICVGLCGSDVEYLREVDRKQAIHMALDEAKDGDVVAILGKGNENYIDINGKKLPYSDIEVVKEFLE